MYFLALDHFLLPGPWKGWPGLYLAPRRETHSLGMAVSWKELALRVWRYSCCTSSGCLFMPFQMRGKYTLSSLNYYLRPQLSAANLFYT